MMELLRRRLLTTLPALAGAFALPLFVAAQGVSPLMADAERRPKQVAEPATQARPAALSLPFFDDFSADPLDATPTFDPVRWEPGSGAYQNNRLGLNPITRGVATFDGLRADGESYGGSFGDTDTLTSRAIDLNGRANVVLSFWLQAGGVGGNLNAFTPMAFQVEMSADDGASWFSELPTSPALLNGTGNATAFEQVFVPVPTVYLTPTFRFRFHSTGVRSGNSSTWNVDYVELDANRTTTPGPRRDVALSRPMPSALDRYTAMPVWQFNNATDPLNELNDSTGTTVNGLDLASGIPTPITYEMTLRVASTDGTILAANVFATGNPVLPGGTRQLPLAGSARNAPTPPLTSELKVLTQEVALVSGESDPLTRINDFIRRQTDLGTYYAYDDGTAENFFSLQPNADPRYGAYAFDTDTADQVGGIALYLYPGGPVNQIVYAAVWDADPANPNLPGLQPRYQQSFRLPADSAFHTLGHWYYVFFSTPQPVSGRFFAGFGQPAVSTFPAPLIGYDFNETRASRRFLVQRLSGGPWRAYVPQAGINEPYGTVMMRPLMNHGGVLGIAKEVANVAAPDVYPNPATPGTVRLQGAFDGGLLVFDALGRTVGAAPANATTLGVQGLPAGVYVLRFRHGTTFTTRRLLLID